MSEILSRIAVASTRSTFERPEEGDDRLNVGIIELCAKSRHLAFDALGDEFRDSGIALFEVIKARPFVSTGIVPMTMGTVTLEQSVAFFCFFREQNNPAGLNGAG